MSDVIQVDLGPRSYEIHIGGGLLNGLGDLCRERGLDGKALLVTDSQVGPHYVKSCVRALEKVDIEVQTVTIPAGEESKSSSRLQTLYETGLDSALDRKSFFVALGGGVVGDLAGYAAATYLRGVRYVQVPTSIVAMVDSAVGGKTGINLARGKNLVGSFHQPGLVVADLDVLGTLSDREYLSGMAEVIKYGVIRDLEFFERLEADGGGVLERDPGILAALVKRSCEIKADVVSKDERESRLRAILNYGHTAGHAIEQATNYDTYLHGEAISMGMVFAGRLSVPLQGFPDDELQRVIELLGRMKLPVKTPDLPWATIRKAMDADKKSRDGVPRFVLNERLGVVVTDCEVPERLMEEVWDVCGK